MNSDFDLLESVLKEISSNSENDVSSEEEMCKHEEVVEDKGLKSCIHCGKEVGSKVVYGKEWRYYGNEDTKHTSDPTRCQARKSEEKTIYKDVENMGFSDKIISIANDIYQQVTKDKIYRGNSRKGIIFACVFHSYKILSKPQSCESLQTVFKLDRKIILKGMKHVNLYAPKNSEVRTTYITPVEIVHEIMEKLNANDEQKHDVVALYEDIQNKSSILNRSKPQSVAAGLVYYYITKNKKEIDIKNYTKIVGLSELTINKIMKEIEKIL